MSTYVQGGNELSVNGIHKNFFILHKSYCIYRCLKKCEIDYLQDRFGLQQADCIGWTQELTSLTPKFEKRQAKNRSFPLATGLPAGCFDKLSDIAHLSVGITLSINYSATFETHLYLKPARPSTLRFTQELSWQPFPVG